MPLPYHYNFAHIFQNYSILWAYNRTVRIIYNYYMRLINVRFSDTTYTCSSMSCSMDTCARL